ncbi:Transporter, LysE family [Marinobacterium lacunae]|uniref:Transporter, LysE family n=1 Tax=Marinobacterium lacunae TaxID=1232683 RepID=A0A081FVQ3_9GAMM|nr:LysE family translocator [Marinobacterium lacunae]KEA62608.1 Transporter, LysE family [Marinobacterium lacunae]
MSSLYLSFSVFAFIASITPGPTNVLALSSGSRQGFTATLPFVIGASFGAALILFLTATGLARLLFDYPEIRLTLAIIGTLWLTWMAFKLYHAPVDAPDGVTMAARPVLWQHGMLMQFVNPKTWLMAMTVSSLFAPVSGAALLHNLALALIFFLVTTPCIAAWAWIGSGSNRVLRSEKQRAGLNRLLAILLALSVWVALYSGTP